VRPNGIALSPDRSVLMSPSTVATHKDNTPRAFDAYSVNADARLWKGPGDIFAELAPEDGLYDGFPRRSVRTDLDEHCKGVYLLLAGRKLIGKILIPESLPMYFRRPEADGCTSAVHVRSIHLLMPNGSKLGLKRPPSLTEDRLKAGGGSPVRACPWLI